MTDYECPSCGGGFPESPDKQCPWCGQSMDGSYSRTVQLDNKVNDAAGGSHPQTLRDLRGEAFQRAGGAQ